jgi:hypothetical protein
VEEQKRQLEAAKKVRVMLQLQGSDTLNQQCTGNVQQQQDIYEAGTQCNTG